MDKVPSGPGSGSGVVKREREEGSEEEEEVKRGKGKGKYRAGVSEEGERDVMVWSSAPIVDRPGLEVTDDEEEDEGDWDEGWEAKLAVLSLSEDIKTCDKDEVENEVFVKDEVTDEELWDFHEGFIVDAEEAGVSQAAESAAYKFITK